MRLGPLLLIIVVSAGAIGYLQLLHHAERETWRAETVRLSGRLERAEHLAEEHAQALAAARKEDRRTETSVTELHDLETRILDAAAELAILETDRAVARERADDAVEDLKEQVRALTTIEMDMAALNQKRRHLDRRVETIEERLHLAEAGAAERQKRSEKLDRDIAGLAIRRETLQSKLATAEKSLAETALAVVARESAEAVGTDIAASSPIQAQGAPPEAPPAAGPQPSVERDDPEETDRSRGLYRFGSLSATPDQAEGGQGGLPPSSDGGTNPALGADWAGDQYSLGLRLLSSAEQSSGTRELSDAILAFKAVLGEWPKERDPMRWAIARSDLGYALALLGKRQGDAGVLEQATAACRDALGEFARDETPLLWAAAQHHLGVSLGGLADMRDDIGLRQASIEALERAIATFKDVGAETDARKAESRLREARNRPTTAPTEPNENLQAQPPRS